MATEEGLRVKIGATVDELLKGISDSKKAIADLAVSTDKEAAAADNAGRKWNQMGKYIFQLNYERKRMLQQVQQGIGVWKLEARAVDEVANKSLPGLQRGTRGATSTLTSFGRIVQDAPYGIIGIGNNITQFAEQFQYLRAQTGSAGGALKALGSSLIGAGGLTLGISLLITGITTLTQKYGSLGNAVHALLHPLSEQQKLQKLVTDSIIKGQQNAQAELARLNTLYDATQNVNLSLSDRNKIVDELQKKYPKYFGDLKNEAILAGAAATKYDELKDSILAAAVARSLEDDLAEQGKALVKLQTEEKKIIEGRLKASKELHKANKNVNIDARKQGAALAQQLTGYGDISSSKAQTAVDKLTNSLRENATEQGNILSKMKALRDQQKQVIETFGVASVIPPGADKEATKKVKTISDVLKILEKELKAVSDYNELVGYSVDDLAGEKLTALNKAFEDIAKIGGPQARKELEKLRKQIDLVSAGMLGDKKLDTKRILSFDKVNIKDLTTGLISERIVARIPIDITLTNTGQAAQKLIDQIKPVFSDAKEATRIEAIDFGATVEKATNDVFKRGAANISSSVAALVGGLASGAITLHDGFKGIIGVIGEFIKNFGEALIAAGTAAIAAKVLIKNPYTAVAAGIAAVAAGALVTSAMNKAPSFATGGGVFQPTMAMIGDNPGREEYVIPSEVLDKLGRGGGYPSEVMLRAHGTDLVGVLKMGQIQSGRING